LLKFARSQGKRPNSFVLIYLRIREDLMQNPSMPAAMLLIGCLAIAFALPSASAQDAQPTPAQPTPAQPTPKVWQPGEVHTGNTRIYVHVFKTGLGHEHAVTGCVKEGIIHLGATQNAGRVVADLTSFVADLDYARKLLGLPGTTDADTQKKVNANMLGAEVLNVAQFPTATATLDSARLLPQLSSNGLPQYLLEGELAFHGVTRKMSVVAEAAEQNGWVRLRGHVTLKQSDFGMTPFTAMLGTIGVADQLELYGEAYIVKESNP
jgi:hypothetical protein